MIQNDCHDIYNHGNDSVIKILKQSFRIQICSLVLFWPYSNVLCVLHACKLCKCLQHKREITLIIVLNTEFRYCWALCKKWGCILIHRTLLPKIQMFHMCFKLYVAVWYSSISSYIDENTFICIEGVYVHGKWDTILKPSIGQIVDI